MNFEEFVADPINFVNEIAQNETEEFDLGMKTMLDNFFKENPEEFFKIPIISTLEDYQKTCPGKIIRLRCSIVEGPSREMFPYRFENKGTFFSCLINQEIPEDVTEINPRTMGDRYCYTAVSIHPMTDWFREQTTFIKDDSKPHVITEKKATKASTLCTPFKINVKTTYEYSNRSNLEVVDFLGTFIEDQCECSDFDGFDASLPTFVGLTYKPSEFYVETFNGEYNPATIKAVRAETLELLNSVFEPLQAETFLMWLLSRTTHFVGGTQIGGLSLNFNESTDEIAAVIDALLKEISPLYQKIDISIDDLNKKDLKPSIAEFEENHSPLFCSSGTKFLIDETKMDVGELNKTGLSNLDLIKYTVYMNQISINIYGADYTFKMYNNVLSVSTTTSMFSYDISMNVGAVSLPKTMPDKDAMYRIRYYLDHQRNTTFDVTKTDTAFLNERLVKYQKEHKNVKQEHLQMLLLFMINMSKSIGEEVITPEACDEAEKLFEEILKNQAQ